MAGLKHACTKCGSRDWPSRTTWCDLCRDDEYETEDEDEKNKMEDLTMDADGIE